MRYDVGTIMMERGWCSIYVGEVGGTALFAHPDPDDTGEWCKWRLGADSEMVSCGAPTEYTVALAERMLRVSKAATCRIDLQKCVVYAPDLDNQEAQRAWIADPDGATSARESLLKSDEWRESRKTYKREVLDERIHRLEDEIAHLRHQRNAL